MNVVLVPGLLMMAEFLGPLRERLEAEGFQCWGPGFHVNLIVRDELALMRRRVSRIAPAILIGHSAGGYLALQLAQEPESGVAAVIGLGTLPIVGPAPPVPYYEARSLWESVLPTYANEAKTFVTGHTCLPFAQAVQAWVIQKCRAIETASATVRYKRVDDDPEEGQNA